MKIQDIARQMADALIEDTRNDGSTFVHLRHKSPEWMTEAAHAAHGDMLPEDTRYRMIREVCEAFADFDDGEIEVYDAVAPLVDCYTADLTRWLASHIIRISYVDEAMSDGGWPTDGGLCQLLMIGQQKEHEEIGFALLSAFETRADETDDTSALRDEE